MHVGCRHAVIVIQEARAQVHELKSYVCRLLLVLNNEYSIHGIDSGQNTLLNIINYAVCVALFSLGMFAFCVLLQYVKDVIVG